LVDGQGLAHPRRFGIACHIGLIADVPSVGVAKSVLVGKFDEIGEAKGSTSPLIHKGEIVGMAVRTKDRVQPIYVSVGHKIGLETAVDLVLRASAGYRVPEPTRQADKLASFRKPASKSKGNSA
jgi:deoxyribonuclease V